MDLSAIWGKFLGQMVSRTLFILNQSIKVNESSFLIQIVLVHTVNFFHLGWNYWITGEHPVINDFDCCYKLCQVRFFSDKWVKYLKHYNTDIINDHSICMTLKNYF